MTTIRLIQTFKCDHHSLAPGELIDVSDDRARQFVLLGIAEYAEPQRAVIVPNETRATEPATAEESRIVVPRMTVGPPPRRGPGRPPRQQG